ncbi:MAG: DUF4114 domain-containing protein [Cyanobacteria bacterium J06621_3]
MLDSVKNDFSVDFGAKELGVNGSNGAGTLKIDGSALSSAGQLGRNYTQSLPNQVPAEGALGSVTDFVRRSAIDVTSQRQATSDPLSSGTSVKQTLASDISQSLAKESQAWQGGLLSKTEAVSTQRSLSQGLSQRQLNNAVGTFVVGSSGKVKAEFLFDGDSRQGELALFNVAGMDNLSRTDFVKEAARRALSGGRNGRIVIKDRTEGAKFGGFLGEQSRNRGKAVGPKTVSLGAGTRFGVMLVPQGTVADARAGKAAVQFSITDMNKGKKPQMAKLANNVYSMESSTYYKSYSDFNDVVFRLENGRGSATNLPELLPANKNWLKDANQPFLKNSGASNPSGPVNKPKPSPAPVSKPEPAPKSSSQGLSQRQLNNAVGTFVVGSSGKVKAEFLFDGDSRQGELALFNVAGMDNLSRTDFVKEAARRALSGGRNGRIVIKDRTEGAKFGGFLGEQSRNRGKAVGPKTVSLGAGTRFGVMLVPQGTVADARAGKAAVQFSITDMNKGKKPQMAKVDNANNVFAMESSTYYKSYSDFNDVVFRMEGTRGSNVPNVSGLLPANKNWVKNSNQPFLKKSGSNSTPDPVTEPKKPTPAPAPIPQPQPNPPASSPSLPGVTSSVSTRVSKFKPSSSEAEIIASGAQKIVLGSQRIYIGTQQVTGINQNPIVRSFDSKNSKNNWTRTDIEVTGTDGRGSGLLWTGNGLYGVFSVDGTQGKPNQDFRRAATGATQNWLESYGPGGGGRISVIAQLDPATGKLLKAAHISAVLQSGKTNSLTVTDATVNKAGNIVLTAKSGSGPRRPDGSLMTRNPGNPPGSPIISTIEINKDLTKVIRTSAKGWS